MATPRAVAPPRIVNIEDLRKAAKRRLPRAVFDYIDGGADREITLDRNCQAYNEVVVPAAVCGGERRTTVSHDGARDAGRAALPPCAGRELAHVLPARRRGRGARGRRGRDGLHPVDAVRLPARGRRRATAGPAWYQLYLVGGRDVALASIERARKAGYSALVVTIDTPVAGLRERDLRNGMKELVSRNPFRCSLHLAVRSRGRAGWPDSSATAG